MSIISQASLFDPPPRRLPAVIGPATVIGIESKHLLTPAKGRMSWCDYTLNPYRGCSFGCSYCYAAFFVADDEQRANWGKWVEVKVRAVEALRRADLRDKRIYMSSVTDPYQPLEAKLGLTREIVDVLAEQGARLVVQTRSPLAARDADLFKKFKNVRVNMSITTDDDAVRRRYEPGCASIERRLEAVSKLKAAGIRVAVSICPMLPMRDPAAFGRLLTRMGVDSAYGSYFHSGKRAFAAGTRDGAWALAEEEGWTFERFSETYETLRRECAPCFAEEKAFGPA
jgi:DNA repair photolyase